VSSFFKKIIISIVFLTVLFSFFAHNSLAQTNFEIVSDKFVLKLKDSQMQFSKNVIVKYKMMEIRCDNVLVEVEPKTRLILRLIMTGNVSLQSSASEAKGNRVIFEPDGEKLTIEGNVKTKIPFGDKN